MRADVAIITSVAIEYQEFLNVGESLFSLTWRDIANLHRSSKRHYDFTETKAGVRIAVIQASKMGQVHASIVARDVLLDLSPSLLLLVGIAAGLGKDGQLGDIICAEQIIDYELGKLRPDAVEPRNLTLHSSPELVQETRRLRTVAWPSSLSRTRPDGKQTNPRIVCGDIICGNKVVADDELRASLEQRYTKAIGLDMESFGVACTLAEVTDAPKFGVIKGICDRAERTKDDKWQPYAAHATSFVVFTLLQNSHLVTNEPHLAMPKEQVDAKTKEFIHSLGVDPERVDKVEHSLVENRIKASLHDISQILKKQVSQEIDHGHHFLAQAEPLFAIADSICAVSIDLVSTFWVSDVNRLTARHYLNCQQRLSTKRLFVFASADSAHNYAAVLDAHEHQYGGVYICSHAHYVTTVLPQLVSSGDIESFQERDFAILTYPTGRKYAELTGSKLEHHAITPDSKQLVNADNLIQLFDQLNESERGTMCDCDSQIYRWKQGEWNNRDAWADILVKMFPERISDAFHLVLFRGMEGEELLQQLANIKRQITHDRSDSDPTTSLRRRHGIRAIWYGTVPTGFHEPTDFRFGGKLQVNSTGMSSMLLMHFDDCEKMRMFEQDELHSRMRRAVYETLDVRVKPLYELADRTKSKKELKALFEGIESIAGHRFARLDFVSSELTRQMVHTTDPYKF